MTLTTILSALRPVAIPMGGRRTAAGEAGNNQKDL
jgi:hypothetical protein